MAKTLIFGGAFDPPHSQHVAICKCAMKELGAVDLVLVPTYAPAHKDSAYLSFFERAKLAEIAFGELGAVVDDIEFRRGGDNYSCNVLNVLKEKYQDIIYLIGGDSLLALETWYHPEELVKICPIAVAVRGGYGAIEKQAEKLTKKYGAEIIILNCPEEKMSSSELKCRLLLGETPEELPIKVAKAIKKGHMFEEYLPYIDKLKGYQTEDLFKHSRAVVLTAAELNARHSLKQNFKQVFLAALLHDNAKQRPSLDGLEVPIDCIGTPVLHQFLGAKKAERDFDVHDKSVLDAIRYHTTARSDMTLLEQLIYTADSVSYDRDYDPIPKLRDIAFEDFDAGFKAVLAHTLNKLRAKGGNIYPLTLEACKYYLN